MQYIKVLATDSTNSSLKKLLRENPLMKNTCLITENQTKGKGQRGNSWHSKPYKNLTFSVLLKNINLNPFEHFKLNALVSLSLFDFLQNKIQIPTISIKWPNDILAGNKKICGILIENILRGKKINHSIIGIGLNVNQTDFENLPQATSLKTITKKDFDLDFLAKNFVEFLEEKIYLGLKKPLSIILKDYQNHLFRKDKISCFEFPDKTQKQGIIKGISTSGKLIISFDENTAEFDLKEIKLLY